jgi:hypothetical protein
MVTAFNIVYNTVINFIGGRNAAGSIFVNPRLRVRDAKPER